MALWVGAILGDAGTASERFRRFLVDLRQVKDKWHDTTISQSDGTLDVAIHCEGVVFAPEFEGLRTGRFSRKKKALQVQVALKKAEVASPDLTVIVANALKQATILAKDYFDKKGIPFSLENHLALVERIRVGLTKGEYDNG